MHPSFLVYVQFYSVARNMARQFRLGNGIAGKGHMAKTIDLGDDDGFLTLSVAGAEMRLDIWEVNNRFCQLEIDFRSKPVADHHAAVADYITTLGYPTLSHRMVCRVVESVYKVCNDLKNADGGKLRPSLPASTGPESSDSDQPTN